MKGCIKVVSLKVTYHSKNEVHTKKQKQGNKHIHNAMVCIELLCNSKLTCALELVVKVKFPQTFLEPAYLVWYTYILTENFCFGKLFSFLGLIRLG